MPIIIGALSLVNIYVKDTQVYRCTSQNLNDLATHLSDLKPVTYWRKDWLLKINTTKTKPVTFHLHWADTEPSAIMISMTGKIVVNGQWLEVNEINAAFVKTRHHLFFPLLMICLKYILRSLVNICVEDKIVYRCTSQNLHDQLIWLNPGDSVVEGLAWKIQYSQSQTTKVPSSSCRSWTFTYHDE